MQNKRATGFLTPLDFPIILFLTGACLAVFPAWDRGLAWAPLAVLLGGGVIYALVSRLGAQDWGQWIILRIAVIGTGLAALFFITQYGHYIEAGKVGPVTRMAQLAARIFPDLSFWRPLGNSMGTLLEGMIFICAAAWFIEKQRAWRIASGIAVLLAGLAVLFSESRGAWLAAAVAGFVWFAARRRIGRWIALVGVAAIVLLAAWVLIAGDIMVLERIPLVGRQLASLFFRPDRLEVYRGSLYLIQDQPFTGLGLGGQFPLVYSRFVLLIQVPFLYYSHNFYLETWLQTGLIGITALVWLVSVVYLMAGRLKRGWLAEGAWAGLTAVFVHGLTDARQYSDLWTWIPFFVLTGLLAAAWLRREETGRTGWWVWLPLTIPLFLIAVLLAMRSPLAVWQTNLGSLEQARVELPAMQNRAAVQYDLADAESRLQRSVEILPRQRSAHMRLGLMLIDREDFAGAVEHLEAALHADPQNPAAQKALGLAYTWAGEVDKAAAALARTPGIVEELNQYAWWRESTGAHDLARYAVRVSLLLLPDQPAMQDVLRRLSK